MKQRKDRQRLPQEMRDPKVPIIHADAPANRVQEQRSEGIPPREAIPTPGPIPFTGPWILPPDWPPVDE